MVQAALAPLSDKQVELLNKFQTALSFADVSGYLKSLAGAVAPGLSNHNVLNATGAVTDGETVTIGGKVYEFDPSNDGVVSGHIPAASVSTAVSTAIPALAAAINANDPRLTAVSLLSGAVLLVYEKEALGQALACTEAMGNGAWASSTMYGGSTVAVNPIAIAARLPKSAEVTATKMHFVFDRPPTLIVAFSATTAGGAASYIGVPPGSVAVSGNVLTITNSGTGDFATTATVVVVVTLA